MRTSLITAFSTRYGSKPSNLGENRPQETKRETRPSGPTRRLAMLGGALTWGVGPDLFHFLVPAASAEPVGLAAMNAEFKRYGFNHDAATITRDTVTDYVVTGETDYRKLTPFWKAYIDQNFQPDVQGKVSPENMLRYLQSVDQVLAKEPKANHDGLEKGDIIDLTGDKLVEWAEAGDHYIDRSEITAHQAEFAKQYLIKQGRLYGLNAAAQAQLEQRIAQNNYTTSTPNLTDNVDLMQVDHSDTAAVRKVLQGMEQFESIIKAVPPKLQPPLANQVLAFFVQYGNMPWLQSYDSTKNQLLLRENTVLKEAAGTIITPDAPRRYNILEELDLTFSPKNLDWGTNQNETFKDMRDPVLYPTSHSERLEKIETQLNGFYQKPETQVMVSPVAHMLANRDASILGSDGHLSGPALEKLFTPWVNDLNDVLDLDDIGFKIQDHSTDDLIGGYSDKAQAVVLNQAFLENLYNTSLPPKQLENNLTRMLVNALTEECIHAKQYQWGNSWAQHHTDLPGSYEINHDYYKDWSPDDILSSNYEINARYYNSWGVGYILMGQNGIDFYQNQPLVKDAKAISNRITLAYWNKINGIGN
jgi:hypothetical protein